MSGFKKASKKQSKLRLAVTGPSGSGKTFSSLRIARGIVGPKGKIAVIDSEEGSASLYSHLFDFDVLEVRAPYHPDKMVAALNLAEDEGYDIAITDSLTHYWNGPGGVLDIHDKATKASRSGNSFQAWKEATPYYNNMVNAILQSGIHVIGTMRTKTAYEIQENEKGKKAPVKVGLAPEQRSGIEYEFTTVFELSNDSHVITVSKDRTALFEGRHDVPSEDMGEEIAKWLNDGEVVPEPKKFFCMTPEIEGKLSKAVGHLGHDTFWEVAESLNFQSGHVFSEDDADLLLEKLREKL